MSAALDCSRPVSLTPRPNDSRTSGRYTSGIRRGPFPATNILFDGRRLWLIDWESAYRNDPLVDVAMALDNFAPSPELETVLLKAWLDGEPDEKVSAGLAPARALTRLYYAGVLFSAAAAANRPEQDTDISALTLDEFTRAIRSGRLKPDTFETSHALGKMYLASFLSGDRPPGLPPPLSAFRIEALE